ncbi:MAG: ABC transporter ATP-binding protein [Oscillospiraceae bacterium]|nr:ABC transporter ATP-binding protein [Oscillospiraceae bacterium]
MSKNLLDVNKLHVAFYHDGELMDVVRDVSFSIKPQETLGLVGESGSGKSVTSKSIMRLIPDPPGKITGGSVIMDGTDILALPKKEMRSIRGGKIAMIFQEPLTSLNPLFTCGYQIAEAVRLHRRCSRKEAMEKAVEMLRLVGVPSPERRIKSYPHELSGGMRQRVMIAMALCCEPALLIADEPTTALDPTIQAQILKLIHELKEKNGMSVLLITHDMGIVAENCDRVAVMYAGQIVEIADVVSIFEKPRHPYTKGLLKAIPSIDKKVDTLYNIDGMVPRFHELPKGCAFSTRCPYARPECGSTPQKLVSIGDGVQVRCSFYDQLEQEVD